MSLHPIEDLQVRVDGLVQELLELPAESREVAAAPLLQRLESTLAEHTLLVAARGSPQADALDELQRREIVRLVGALQVRGDVALWCAALADLRAALDVVVLGGDSRWGHDT
jgi:hypothetical protein